MRLAHVLVSYQENPKDYFTYACPICSARGIDTPPIPSHDFGSLVSSLAEVLRSRHPLLTLLTGEAEKCIFDGLFIAA